MSLGRPVARSLCSPHVLYLICFSRLPLLSSPSCRVLAVFCIVNAPHRSCRAVPHSFTQACHNHDHGVPVSDFSLKCACVLFCHFAWLSPNSSAPVCWPNTSASLSLCWSWLGVALIVRYSNRREVDQTVVVGNHEKSETRPSEEAQTSTDEAERYQASQRRHRVCDGHCLSSRGAPPMRSRSTTTPLPPSTSTRACTLTSSRLSVALWMHS